jgi:hypothetical protein
MRDLLEFEVGGSCDLSLMEKVNVTVTSSLIAEASGMSFQRKLYPLVQFQKEVHYLAPDGSYSRFETEDWVIAKTGPGWNVWNLGKFQKFIPYAIETSFRHEN